MTLKNEEEVSLNETIMVHGSIYRLQGWDDEKTF
jgi:hypothetical protein